MIVNGRKITIPSYQVRDGDIIGIRPGSRDKGLFQGLDEKLKEYTPPSWLILTPEEKSGTVKGQPLVSENEMNINFGNILEFYSRV